MSVPDPGVEVRQLSIELLGECRLIDLEVKGDERGQLIALEALRNVPFAIRRAFFIYGT